jgi:hypothetical protein
MRALARTLLDPVLGRTDEDTGPSGGRYDSDGPPALHWAGDLDREGKSDLVIDITNHYNLSRMALFLSSLAKEGELVGLAGFFDSGGC